MAYTAQPVGFLADVNRRILEYANEAMDTPKWTSDRTYPLICETWARMMDDFNGIGDCQIVINYTMSVTPDTQNYLLPGNFGTFLQLGKDPGSQGKVYEVALPRHRLNPVHGGFVLLGNYLRFEPKWYNAESLILQYMPSGYCSIHMGVSDMASASSSTIYLDQDPSEGYFDSKPNAYLGCVIRILGGNEITEFGDYTYFPLQERIITGYDPETALATVTPAFDFDVAVEGIGEVAYEVVPFLSNGMEEAIAWHVASAIHEIEGRGVPADRCLRRYQMQMRLLRSRFANMNARNGQAFIGDVPGNGRYGTSYSHYGLWGT